MGVEVALFALTAAATVYSVDQQKDAAKKQARAQQKAEELNKKRGNVRNARARAKQVRMARAQRATALAQGQSGEGTGGSGLTGAQATIGNNAAGNISFLNKNQEISNDLSDLSVSSAKGIAKSKGNAAMGSAVAGIASSANSVFGES